MISPATLEDSRDIWSWRNDVLTREMSLTTDKVSWESHQAWFAESLRSQNRRLFIGRVGEAKIGMCRFDINAEQNTAQVSINLNPGQRGQGLSHPLLAAAMRLFLRDNPLELLATIKKKNAASIRCFGKCGFVFTSADEIYNFYRYAVS